jgi:peptidoglycan endopeptidase LytE
MFRKLYPCALVISACAFLSTAAIAQTPVRSQAKSSGIDSAYSVNDDPVIISTAAAATSRSVEDPKPALASIGAGALAWTRLQPLLWEAIDERLGARYRWGSEGPYLFDCSGFVWSSFHSIGIDFERGSARALWGRFQAPTPEETFKFGTLVFFSHQRHVGIVADEKGFFHASRHHGVIYSPFNDYWKKRVDGFRRVPLPAVQSTPVVAMKR